MSYIQEYDHHQSQLYLKAYAVCSSHLSQLYTRTWPASEPAIYTSICNMLVTSEPASMIVTSEPAIYKIMTSFRARYYKHL